MVNTMLKFNKWNLIPVFLISLILFGAGCKQNNDSKDKLAAGLLLLGLSNGEKSSTTTTISSLQNSTTAISSAVASYSSSNNGIAALQIGKDVQIKQMMADARRNALRSYLKKTSGTAIPTASTITASSGNCTYSSGTSTTTCNATLNGTGDCNGGGSFALNNVAVNMTLKGGAAFNFSGSLNGGVSFNKCKVTGTNWAEFPGQISTLMNGNVVFNNSFTETLLLNTATPPAQLDGDIVYKDSGTYASDAVSTDGKTAIPVNIYSSVDLSMHSVVSGLSSTVNGNISHFSATYNQTINGTYTVTGTADSASVNINKTYTNDVFKYFLNCSFNSDTGSSSCTVTML
jgi:hypothetical protein